MNYSSEQPEPNHSLANQGVSAPARRRYGYRLSTLLLLFVIAAVALTWWSRRQRAIEIEESRIAGTWVMVNNAGSRLIMPDGKPLVVEFARSDFQVDPFQEPKQIDFTMRNKSGGSFGIYRWEGDNLRVKEAGTYVERPTSFNPERPDEIKFKKGLGPLPLTTIMTETTYLLERLPTPSSK